MLGLEKSIFLRDVNPPDMIGCIVKVVESFLLSVLYRPVYPLHRGHRWGSNRCVFFNFFIFMLFLFIFLLRLVSLSINHSINPSTCSLRPQSPFFFFFQNLYCFAEEYFTIFNPASLALSNQKEYAYNRHHLSTQFLVLLNDGFVHAVTASGHVRWSRSITPHSLNTFNQTSHVSSVFPDAVMCGVLGTSHRRRVVPQLVHKSNMCYTHDYRSTDHTNESRRFVPAADGQIFYKSEDGYLTPLPLHVRDVVFHSPFSTPLFPSIYFIGKRETLVDILDFDSGQLDNSLLKDNKKYSSDFEDTYFNTKLRIGQTRWVVKAMDGIRHVEKWRLEWRELTPIMNFGGETKNVETVMLHQRRSSGQQHNARPLSHNQTNNEIVNGTYQTNSSYSSADMSFNYNSSFQIPVTLKEHEFEDTVVNVKGLDGHMITLYLNKEHLLISRDLLKEDSYADPVDTRLSGGSVNFRFCSIITAVYAVERESDSSDTLVLRPLIDMRNGKRSSNNYLPHRRSLEQPSTFQGTSIHLPYGRFSGELVTYNKSPTAKIWENPCCPLSTNNNEFNALWYRRHSKPDYKAENLVLTSPMNKIQRHTAYNASRIITIKLRLSSLTFILSKVSYVLRKYQIVVRNVVEKMRRIRRSWRLILFLSLISWKNLVCLIVLSTATFLLHKMYSLSNISEFLVHQPVEWFKQKPLSYLGWFRIILCIGYKRFLRGFSIMTLSEVARTELHCISAPFMQFCRTTDSLERSAPTSTSLVRSSRYGLASKEYLANDSDKCTMQPNWSLLEKPLAFFKFTTSFNFDHYGSDTTMDITYRLIERASSDFLFQKNACNRRYGRRTRNGFFSQELRRNFSFRPNLGSFRSYLATGSTSQDFFNLVFNSSSVLKSLGLTLEISHSDRYSFNYCDVIQQEGLRSGSSDEMRKAIKKATHSWRQNLDFSFFPCENDSIDDNSNNALLFKQCSYNNMSSDHLWQAEDGVDDNMMESDFFKLQCFSSGSFFKSRTSDQRWNLFDEIDSLASQDILCKRRKRQRIDSLSIQSSVAGVKDQYADLVNSSKVYRYEVLSDSKLMQEQAEPGQTYSDHGCCDSQNPVEAVANSNDRFILNNEYKKSLLVDDISKCSNCSEKAGTNYLPRDSAIYEKKNMLAEANETQDSCFESHKICSNSFSSHTCKSHKANVKETMGLASKSEYNTGITLPLEESVTLPPPLFSLTKAKACRHKHLPRLKLSNHQGLQKNNSSSVKAPHHHHHHHHHHVGSIPLQLGHASSGTNEMASSQPSSCQTLIPPDSVLAAFVDNGRFYRTFTDIHMIGKGGFGSVYRVKHRFEPNSPEYAVKFVTLRLKASENISSRRYFREVSANRDLFSRQVVRYFTWWCEEPQFLPQDPNSSTKRMNHVSRETTLQKAVRQKAGGHRCSTPSNTACQYDAAVETSLPSTDVKCDKSHMSRETNMAASRRWINPLSSRYISCMKHKGYVKRRARERLKVQRHDQRGAKYLNSKPKKVIDKNDSLGSAETVSCDPYWEQRKDSDTGWIPFTSSFSSSSDKESYFSSCDSLPVVLNTQQRVLGSTDSAAFQLDPDSQLPSWYEKQMSLDNSKLPLVKHSPNMTNSQVSSLSKRRSGFPRLGSCRGRLNLEMFELKQYPRRCCANYASVATSSLRERALKSIHCRQLAWLISRPGALASTPNLACQDRTPVKREAMNPVKNAAPQDELTDTDFIVFERSSFQQKTSLRSEHSEEGKVSFDINDNNRRNLRLRKSKHNVYPSCDTRGFHLKRRDRKHKRNKRLSVAKREERRFAVTLLIQMELVSGMTLREWLDREERETDARDVVARFHRSYTSNPAQSLCFKEADTSRTAELKGSHGCGGSIKKYSRPTELILFRQLVKGLKDIHTHGIVHRDIKPENIFVEDADLTLKIGDFGLARFVEAKTISSGNSLDDLRNRNYAVGCLDRYSLLKRLFRANVVSFQGPIASPEIQKVDSVVSVKGLVIGTPGYTAPEGGALCTEKADIFSASLILLELLCPRFSTAMERYKTLENFRTRQKIPEHITMYFPYWADLMKKMGELDPHERPSARMVYNSIKIGLNPLLYKIGLSPNVLRHLKLESAKAAGTVSDSPLESVISGGVPSCNSSAQKHQVHENTAEG